MRVEQVAESKDDRSRWIPGGWSRRPDITSCLHWTYVTEKAGGPLAAIFLLSRTYGEK